MSTDPRAELRAMMRRANQLPPNQRIVLNLYGVLPKNPAGAVETLARVIADEAGMKESTFSKVRTALVDDGWLEESSRVANVRYYRLTGKALGTGPTVIPLLRPAG